MKWYMYVLKCLINFFFKGWKEAECLWQVNLKFLALSLHCNSLEFSLQQKQSHIFSCGRKSILQRIAGVIMFHLYKSSDKFKIAHKLLKQLSN